MNIYVNDTPKSKFQNINALLFEWELDVEYIKRVRLAADVSDTGANGSMITMAFTERYYEKYDTFRAEGSKDLFIVLTPPVRKADNYWEVGVQLINPDRSATADLTALKSGMPTRFISNHHPELSEEGYTKYQSNIERHRNYITLHRCDVSFSAQFAALEDVFISVGQGKDKNETIYKMKKKEQELLDTFMYVRNNGCLFSKNNHDANGRCTVFDPQTQRPIPIGDGIIAQVERYANKYAYAKLSTNVFDTVMEYMRQKSKSSTGNQYAFIVNEKLWSQIQRTLREYLKDFKTNGVFFYSKQAGGNVEVGATFDTYVMGGNQISFHVDKAFTLEYPDRGYGICIDLTADAVSGTPAMQMFTIKNGEFIRGVLKGIGGLDGTTSGEVATGVAGSKIIHMGYSGVGIYNPYKSFIIEENI